MTPERLCGRWILRSARLALLTALALILLAGGTAQATTVSAFTNQIAVLDDTGVTDDLVLTLRDAASSPGTDEVVVSDASGKPLTPGPDCVQGASSSQVVCTHVTAGGKFLEADVNLHLGDDDFTAANVTGFGLNVSGGEGRDKITGGDADASTVALGAQQADFLEGEGGDDVLTSRQGDDTLNGELGDDVLVPSRFGAQLLSGGDGLRDRASYADYTAGVSLVIGGGAVSGSNNADNGTLRPKDQINGDIEVLRSGSGVDTLVGDNDGERFDAGTGGDSVDGNGGTDVVGFEERSTAVTAALGGTAGVNSEDTITEVENLTGGSGADRLTGDDGPNLLDGGAGADILNGAGADDVLLGKFGADDHTGGPGVDEATYRDRSDRVSVTVGAVGGSGNDDDGPAGSRDRIRQDVERVVGSSDDDLLVGDGNPNQLHGAGGADDLQGMNGNDLFSGGPGPDVLTGGGGARDVASYSERTTRPVSVTIGGGPVSGGREDGPAGSRDTVANDVEDLIGGAAADTLVGSPAANILDGGLGGDNMQGLGGTDTVTYATRTLVVTVTVGGTGGNGTEDGAARDSVATDIETVVGGSNNDTLTGTEGSQTLQGGLGNDTLAGGDDPDDLVGGEGFDTANYASTGGAVTATIGVVGGSGSSLDGPVGARDTVRIDVEKLLGGSSPDTLTGSPNADTLEGGDGDDILRGVGDNDTLIGRLGDDTLEGGAGDDTMSGNEDNDTFDGGTGADAMNGFTHDPTNEFPGDTVLYDDRTTPVDVTVNGGALDGDGGSADVSATTPGKKDHVTSIETVIGGQASDRLVGMPITVGVPNLARLVGAGGGDTLIGSEVGKSELEGGVGEDTLEGRGGSNTMDGGTERDIITGAAGNDTLLGGAANDDLDGAGGIDVLSGQAGPDHLEGGTGDDELDGGTEDDQLIGGFGSDFIDGGAGIDRASYADRTSTGVVATIGPFGGSGNADDGLEDARDTIATDVENLLGGGGGDTLTGNGAANEIDGAAGPDSIRGGHGPDTLRGGPGRDNLFSRDAFSDSLFCDADPDTAEVDASDVTNGCESVIVG